MDIKIMGEFIQERRRRAGLTQEELGERLGVSFQSVSNWERGVSCPDTALLLDLARILGVSTDAILTGGRDTPAYRRRVTVAQLREAIDCVMRMGELLGRDNFMYRAAVDGLNERMNSDIEPAFYNQIIYTAYVCEALLACVREGDYVDVSDIRRNLPDCRPREYALAKLAEMGIK